MPKTGERITEGNILQEAFHDYGKGLATAKAAFKEIEDATKIKTFDISISAFLSPWRQDNDTIKTSFLNGQPLFSCGPSGIVPRELRTVTVDVPKAFEGIVGSILVDGGLAADKEKLDGPDLYILNSNAFYGLSRSLKLGYTSTGTEKLIHDQAFAVECANMMEEVLVNAVYREKDGVKKVFGITVEEKKCQTLEAIMQAVEEISARSGKLFYIGPWDITQKQRKVTFLDEEGEGLTFSFSDCCPRTMKVLHGRSNRVAVEGKTDMVKAGLLALAE